MDKQETKHTQGPWRVEETIGAPMVVAGERSSAEERRISTYREIAQVRYYLGSEDVSLVEANAKLIAAAPLMLKRLQEMEWSASQEYIEFCVACGRRKSSGHARNCKTAAAIKEALGETKD